MKNQGWRSKYLLKNKKHVKNNVKEKKQILYNYAKSICELPFTIHINSYRVQLRKQIIFSLRIKLSEEREYIIQYPFNEITEELLKKNNTLNDLLILLKE